MEPVKELMRRARIAMGRPTYYGGIPALIIRMSKGDNGAKHRKIAKMKGAPIGRVLQENNNGTVTVLFKAEEVIDFLREQGIDA